MNTTANEDAQHRCPRCLQWFVVNTLLRAHPCPATKHP